jgi:hypothetical protein
MKGQMTDADFKAFRNSMTIERFEMCDEKSIEYTRDNKDDRLCNFTRIGEELKLSWYYVWWVYIKKHLDAIVQFIKSGLQGSEGIKGRIFDAQNYLDLLLARIESEKESS